MDLAETAKSFFTAESLLTLGGAPLAIVAVGNTWQRLVGSRPVWPGFVASVILTFGGALSVHQLNGFFGGVIGFFNACLLFSTAAGIQEAGVATGPASVAGAEKKPLGVGAQQGATIGPGRQWRTSWFS